MRRWGTSERGNEGEVQNWLKRRKILDAASSPSPEQQDEVFLGIWSVKDPLAHLAGWDVTNIDDETSPGWDVTNIDDETSPACRSRNSRSRE